MASTTRRRYRVGEHPEYDNIFDRLAQASVFLNPSGPAAADISNFTVVQMMNTQDGLTRLLEELEGAENSDGDYIEKRRLVPSKLKAIQLEITELQESFARQNQRRVNEGYRPLKEITGERLKTLHELQAREDIVRDEIKKLRQGLDKFTQRAAEEQKHRCLFHGPRGSGRLRGGILVVLDGQDVMPDPEGVLRIKDTNSPYNGMQVVDYRERISVPWRKAHMEWEGKIYKEALAAKLEGRERKSVGPRPALPDWPKGIERYDWDLQKT